MVIVLEAKEAVTPAGKPVAAPIPVAPVVAIVILVNEVLIHRVGVEEGDPAVLVGITVIVFDTLPLLIVLVQPPVVAAILETVIVAVPAVVSPVAVNCPLPAVVTVIGTVPPEPPV